MCTTNETDLKNKMSKINRDVFILFWQFKYVYYYIGNMFETK